MPIELLLASLPDHLRHRNELSALKMLPDPPDELLVEHCFQQIPNPLRERCHWDDLRLKAEALARSLAALPQVQFLSRWEGNFPERLLTIPDSPWGVFIRGEVAALHSTPLLAVVGTRRPNLYGTQIVESLLGSLGGGEFTLVSGLAYGIDSAAHAAALRQGAVNIGVLGHGIDFIYPPGSEPLARSLLQRDGALVSEYPPGEPPHKSRFPARNRIVSGLSHGVWVVQGGPRSGTFSTARHAAEQGRSLGATPGSIFSELAHAPHEILKAGGTTITDVTDLRLFLGLAAPGKIQPQMTLL